MRGFVKCAAFVFVLLSEPSVCAQQVNLDNIKANDRVPLSLEVKRVVLSNGFTYYLGPTKSRAEKIFIRLDVKAYVDETKFHGEIPHIVEHALFRRTIEYSHDVGFKEYMNGAGITYNAHPGKEITQYYFELPFDTAKAEMIFKVLAGWVAGKNEFTTEAVEREKEVVTAERIRTGIGSEQITFGESVLIKKLLQTRTEGMKDAVTVIRETSAAEVKQFYQDWYRPDLAALYVLGDFDTSTIEGRVKRLFGDVKKPTKAPPSQASEGLKKNRFLVEWKPAKSNSKLSLNLYFIKRNSVQATYGDFKEAALVEIFNLMIKNRFGEPYNDKIHSKADISPRGLPYGTFLLNFSRSIDMRDSLEADLKKLFTESARIKRYGFDSQELDLAKAFLLSKDREVEPGLRDQANWYSENFLYGTAAPSFQVRETLRQKFLKEITLEEMNDAVRRWTALTRKIVISAPDTLRSSIPSEKTVFKWLKEIQNEKNLPKYEKKESQEVVVNVDFDGRYHVPASATYARKDFEEQDVTQLKLSNGTQVIIKTAVSPASDRTHVQGIRSFEKTNQGSSDLLPMSLIAHSAAESGLGELSKDEFHLYKSNHSIKTSINLEPTGMILRGSGPQENEEILFQLIYRYFVLPKEDSVADISLLSPPREMIFVVTGTHDLERTIAFAAKYLGNLPEYSNAQPKAQSRLLRPEGSNVSKVVVNKTLDKYEARVSLSYTGPYVASSAGNMKMRLLAGVMEQVLFRRLREKEGGTYQVDCGARFPSLHSYEVKTSFKCTPEFRERLIAAAQQEIAVLQKNGPDISDLKIAAKTFKNRIMLSAWDDGNWAYWITEQYRFGGDFKGAFELEALIDSITPEDIQKAAQEYLKPERFIAYSEVPAEN